MILLWLTTILPNAKPPLCDLRVPKSCQSPTPVQYSLLFSAFALMSIGAGGIRPCSLAFGADQIDCKDNPKRERLLESFFGWYYASALMGVLLHWWYSCIHAYLVYLDCILTGIVLYSRSSLDERSRLGIPVEKSLFTSLCQVVSVAWKNRKVPLPDSSDGSWYYRNDTKVATPTKNLSWAYGPCANRTVAKGQNANNADEEDAQTS
ncbi:NRT1/ PTR family 1.2-like protein [Tanacetum coccineum]|uniref:NRT1/ PTR family 1.2-like protein n=1 Tax=Tanacetum coccineum TaxID=301880 RepID=A0ABQ5BXQ8_9ASTR